MYSIYAPAASLVVFMSSPDQVVDNIYFCWGLQQKVVIKVSFNGENKSRTKVMQAAVAVPGN